MTPFPKSRWFVRGDIDGFFGLFLDNLLQLMVISVLGEAVCGFPPGLINGRILPGAALSILVGNLFYAWQARQLARRNGREDVTALPYGINTPSVVAFIFLIIGPVLAWALRMMGYNFFETPSQPVALHFYPFAPTLSDLITSLASPVGWRFLAVIFPMGLFTVIGSLQNLESAEAAGDRYETRSSLLANGIGTLCAAAFGSSFPTTIYIGHPGWKAMGARSGYSAANGIVISALCLLGGVSLVLKVIPMEATLGILVWISVIITAQAFQETPKGHALAVAVGLIPSLATWALILIEMSLRAAGSSLFAVAPKFGADLFVHGVIALSQGFIITSMILAAILAFSID